MGRSWTADGSRSTWLKSVSNARVHGPRVVVASEAVGALAAVVAAVLVVVAPGTAMGPVAVVQKALLVTEAEGAMTAAVADDAAVNGAVVRATITTTIES